MSLLFTNCKRESIRNIRGSSAYSWTETAFAISGTVSNCAMEVVSFARLWSHVWTFNKRNDSTWVGKKVKEYLTYRHQKRGKKEKIDEDVEKSMLLSDESQNKSDSSSSAEGMKLLLENH